MQEIIFKMLLVMISFCFYFQSKLIKGKVGTYLFPPCIFSMAWFFFTIFPLLFLPQIVVSLFGIAYIFTCTLAFSLSAIPFNWKLAYEKNATRSWHYLNEINSPFIKYCFYGSVTLAILFTIIAAMNNGFDFHRIFFNLMEVSKDYARKREAGQINYAFAGKVSVMFMYGSSALGALLYCVNANKFYKNFILVFSLIPALYVMLTQSSKIVLIIAIFYFIASNLLFNILSNKLEIFNKKIIIKIFFCGLILILPVVVSIIARGNNLLGNIGIFNLLLHSFNSYVLGSFLAFSDFFANYLGFPSLIDYEHHQQFWGRYTVKSIFDFLNMGSQFPVGIYSEQYKIDNLINTNIYTIFRGLIYDFGIFGSIVFIFLIGLVINGFFYRLLSDEQNIFAAVFFITSIVFILFTDLMSLFMARYTFLVFAFLYFVLKCNALIYKIPTFTQDGK